MTEVALILIGLAVIYVIVRIIVWLIKMTLILAVVAAIGGAIYISVIPTEMPNIPNKDSVDKLIDSLKN